MKRKNTFKSIITMMLCMMILLTGLHPQTTFAATKKYPVKVTFNKKTATLMKDMNDPESTPTIKTLTAKWGKPKKTANDTFTFYTWKKGKSTIEIINGHSKFSPQCEPNKNGVGEININIKDKNMAIWGITVGTKRADAVKKLKKAIPGKVHLDSLDEDPDEKGNEELYADDFAIYIKIEKGKVAYIQWSKPVSVD